MVQRLHVDTKVASIPPLARMKVDSISRLHHSADGTAQGTAKNFCTSAAINYRVA